MTHEGALEFSSVTDVEAHAARRDSAQDQLGELEQLAAGLVGRAALEGAINRLRRAMLCEALSRTSGNFTRAALLLGVQRQAVQNMVTRYDLRQWARAVRRSSDPGDAHAADAETQLPRTRPALDDQRGVLDTVVREVFADAKHLEIDLRQLDP